MRISVFDRGSMIGAEDAFYARRYTANLQCITQKGTVLALSRDNFMKLNRFENVWNLVLHQIAFKLC